MKYYIHFQSGVNGPYWSVDYAKEKALRAGPDLLESMEIQSERGQVICRSAFHSGWHDPDTDGDFLINLGEVGWFEMWK